jgi:hypothetical protein
MTDLDRRGFLVAVGCAGAGTLAGCLEEGEEFLVTNTQIGIQSGTDILVRVTIENISDEQRSGLLEVILGYYADGDTDSDPDETWERTRQLTVKQAASPQLEFVFESAYSEDRDITDYAVDASIDPDE